MCIGLWFHGQSSEYAFDMISRSIPFSVIILLSHFFFLLRYSFIGCSSLAIVYCYIGWSLISNVEIVLVCGGVGGGVGESALRLPFPEDWVRFLACK